MKQSFLTVSFLILHTLTAGARPVQDQLNMKIGQMIMIGFRGTTLQEAPNLKEDITMRNLGGVVLFDYDVPSKSPGRNITSPQQLKKLTDELQEAAKTPLLIAADQEGGRIARLKTKYGFPESPSAKKLGLLNNPDSTYHAALKIAESLQKAGINVNFSPVVDLDSNSENPVIGSLERSFSADPDIVTSQAITTVRALHTKKIIATLKHFPGHGSSATDTHKDFTDITESWNKTELEPYRKLIDHGYSDLVMTAHVYNARLDSIFPATLSKPVVTGLLRNSLGFKGPVISDDMQMKAVSDHYSLETAILQAIDAGVDILLFANNSSYDPGIARKAISIIHSLVENGTISPARIDSSYQRITTLKQQYLTVSK
ncbi:glycoside hydrolase family 3 protein [Prosthecochloris sp. SCSIO W1101]|uniref:glycoside hydrolase family 3 protein n=1 Tax=Prosthecochloris sp. SCSIO W1101 TaxID=2992242 RepID=UPI00223D9B2D|nr:glycoside hydrolase family 3 protein [Prosthecochloris sp. SCSIO W1101]UZJ41347.1 glycoside hydrolase family 3 protein [Prosthecochloris sp. SCSIO W1101]